jgi:uncharacterized protein YheU (UPF0270 family)
MSAPKIPYDQLNPETLHGVIEEFVTRYGTDYGEIEVPLWKQKSLMCMHSLNQKTYENAA